MAVGEGGRSLTGRLTAEVVVVVGIATAGFVASSVIGKVRLAGVKIRATAAEPGVAAEMVAKTVGGVFAS